MEDYSVIKEILPFTMTWMDIYAKWNKSDKDKYHMISLICEIFKKKKKTHRYREQIGGWEQTSEENEWRDSKRTFQLKN